MNLKDEIVTVTWNGSAYKVNRPRWYGGDVIPVEALRERLKSIANSGSHDYWEIGYCAAFKELLAELEGL